MDIAAAMYEAVGVLRQAQDGSPTYCRRMA
jgi:hypothetical protein